MACVPLADLLAERTVRTIATWRFLLVLAIINHVVRYFLPAIYDQFMSETTEYMDVLILMAAIRTTGTQNAMLKYIQHLLIAERDRRIEPK